MLGPMTTEASSPRAELRGSPGSPGPPGPPNGSSRSSFGRIYLIIGAIVVAGLAIRWVTSGTEDGGGPLFRTAVVEQRRIVQTVEANGFLRPRAPLLVLSPVQGRLAEVVVEARQKVKKGDLLARLDARSLVFDARRAEAGVAAARGALSEAKVASAEAAQQRARAERLAKRGQVSKADLQKAVSASDRAKAAVRVALDKLSEAKATLTAAQFAEAQTDVSAPKDGVVLTVPEQMGLAVSPAGPVLFTISAPLEVLRLEAAVGEADIGQLAVGQPAEFEVQAYPGRKFSANVEAIGVVAKTSKGVATYAVELNAPNPDGRLLPGMSTAVRFEVARADDALAVRDAALRFAPVEAEAAPPRSRVFKISGDGLDEVAVKIGITDGIWAEVKSIERGALSAGDAVAVGYATGSPRATPGLKIGGR